MYHVNKNKYSKDHNQKATSVKKWLTHQSITCPTSTGLFFSSRLAYCMFYQLIHGYKAQSLFMGSFQYHFRCNSSIQGFFPSIHAQAPAISRLQSGKLIVRNWSCQVIPSLLCVTQELLRHHCANSMGTNVHWPCITASISKKAGKWLSTTGNEWLSKYIQLCSYVLHFLFITNDQPKK